MEKRLISFLCFGAAERSGGAAADPISAISSQVAQYAGVVFALAAVLVFAYVVLRMILPRLLGIQRAEGCPIQVLARYSLEPKKTLYLVKIGTQISLIGTAETQIQYLAAVSPDSLPDLTQPAKVQGLPTIEFRKLLNKFQRSDDAPDGSGTEL